MSDISFTRKSTDYHMGVSGGSLPLLKFDAISDLGFITHCFTTRSGGVSEGYFSSLNLKTGLGDPDENVTENFRRVAAAMNISPADFVLSQQTHTTNVRVVTYADKGKGVTKPRDYTDVDGLVTNVPGIVLGIFSADCVPLIFIDPVKKCIGAAHSGWRGTVGRIAAHTIEVMHENYGSDPSDMICAIGPSICRDCYEVSEDVATEFKKEFPGYTDEILEDRHNGHYQLDLWAACRITMEEAGVRPSNIYTTDICTCENSSLLFSHRASHGKRGVQGTFLSLR